MFDAVLIKDNHLRLAGSIADAVQRARGTGVPVEVECDTLDQAREAFAADADRILLDNMPPPQLREAVALVDGRARLEASGGITLENVRAVAESGVDVISVGALTHSSPSLDVSLEILWPQPQPRSRRYVDAAARALAAQPRPRSRRCQ